MARVSPGEAFGHANDIKAEDILFKLNKSRMQHNRLLEFLEKCVYLLGFIFIIASQAKIGPNYLVREVVRRDIIEASATFIQGGEKVEVNSFEEITALADAMDWMEYVLIPIVYPETHYNGS